MENSSAHLSFTTISTLKSIEVFKTNVVEQKEADQLSAMLYSKFPRYDIHFDLEDCDRILRVEGDAVHNEHIISLLANHGYDCAALL